MSDEEDIKHDVDAAKKDFEILSGGPLSDQERLAGQWADAAITNQLPTLRATAQHWQTTISTIIGLFGAATIITSDESVASLKYPGNVIYGVSILLSLAAAGYALYRAALAGESSPATIGADIAGRVAEYNRLVRKSTDGLQCSRVVTGLAIALLLIATGIRWYSPKNPPPPPTVISVPAQPHG